MRKSLIEISKPETRSFSGYAELADHLKAVNDASEWTIVRSEETSFDGDSGANTFEAMGGDEFSCVTVSFDEGSTQVPLRYTALTSILNRCEISGDGIKKLFLSDKEYFAKHLNRYLSLKDNAKRQMLALVQDGKLSALHSKAYTPINQVDVFDLVEDYLQDFDNVEFLTAEWSWEQTQAVYEIRDNDFLSVYRKLLKKHFPGKKDCAVRMRAISSDVAEAAVRFNTFLLVGGLSLPLNGSISVKHMGKVTIETVQEKMKGVFSSFEASCRSLAGLADIPIRHKKNAMIKIFTDLHIPQRYAAESCERYDNTLTNALDIYTSLAEVLIAMKGKVAASSLLSYEEALARVITYPRNRWSSFDIPGVVAWGAASKALSKIA